MKRKAGIACLAAALICGVIFVPSDKNIAAEISKRTAASVIVLDPGHGGMDGGAQSSAGISEKDINLSICIMLRELLEKDGFKVIMTREDDRALCDENSQGTIRSHKTEDMKERKQIIDQAGADLAVSIHLNSFTQDPDVKGAQVFYPAAAGDSNCVKSNEAAELIQQSLNKTINVEKDRTELGKNDVFILKNIRCPVVIVECGFLSNPQEAEALNKHAYQAKIAKSLQTGICSYIKAAAQ